MCFISQSVDFWLIFHSAQINIYKGFSLGRKHTQLVCSSQVLYFFLFLNSKYK